MRCFLLRREKKKIWTFLLGSIKVAKLKKEDGRDLNFLFFFPITKEKTDSESLKDAESSQVVRISQFLSNKKLEGILEIHFSRLIPDKIA
jgi:hypothetical protein